MLRSEKMPLTEEQRRAIVSLANAGQSSQQIAAQTGVSPRTVAAVKAQMSRGTYDGISTVANTEADTDVTNAVDTASGLERDLQLASI
jgi:IS30 family transposase